MAKDTTVFNVLKYDSCTDDFWISISSSNCFWNYSFAYPMMYLTSPVGYSSHISNFTRPQLSSWYITVNLEFMTTPAIHCSGSKPCNHPWYPVPHLIHQGILRSRIWPFLSNSTVVPLVLLPLSQSLRLLTHFLSFHFPLPFQSIPNILAIENLENQGEFSCSFALTIP